MTFKEFILKRVQLFFVLVTFILIASGVVGMIFAPEREIRYVDLFDPIILAGLCVLPTLVTFYKKQPTNAQYAGILALRLVLIEGIVITVLTPPSDQSAMSFYLTIGFITFIIYVISFLIFCLRTYFQSVKLTNQLKKMQTGM